MSSSQLCRKAALEARAHESYRWDCLVVGLGDDAGAFVLGYTGPFLRFRFRSRALLGFLP